MCYNGCPYESFNPLTGDCHCRKGRNPCPEELVYCDKCGDTISDLQADESYDKYDKELCEDCVETMLEEGDLLITCVHCGEKFEDEGYGKCPACRRKYD